MSNRKHTLTQFDAELDEVREQVMLMGCLVESQIRLAIEALKNNDVALMERVIEDDHRVNGMEVTIDEKCVQIIARRQPAANDLRMVMTVIKTITDMERIGDEAKKIARMGKLLSHQEHFRSPRYTEIRHAANLVLDMLHQSLDSFARLDISGVTHVIRQDELVDKELHHSALPRHIDDGRPPHHIQCTGDVVHRQIGRAHGRPCAKCGRIHDLFDQGARCSPYQRGRD